MPLITFDVGGVGEMLEYSDHPDIIVMDTTAKSLSKKLQGKPARSWFSKLSEHFGGLSLYRSAKGGVWRAVHVA